MHSFTIITSVYPPTAAVRAYAAMMQNRLVVVGDRKTDPDWQQPGAIFLSLEAQAGMNSRMAALLPYGHYSRKMLGYLYAIREGAERILDTDDDILPYEDWNFPAWTGEHQRVTGPEGFVNVYRYFSEQPVWPRGFPLDKVRESFSEAIQTSPADLPVGIWQGLSQGDPDVDAVYRLSDNSPCEFQQRPPLVLGAGHWCPFNSQNTCFRKELFPLLYLPTRVSFRFTDILRSLVAQPILWLHGYHLGFTAANTRQLRNPHDYFEDLLQEIPMYQNAGRIPQILDGVLSSRLSIQDNLVQAYRALCDEKIVPADELPVLEAWLGDL